jgi:uncharacterized surface protein with fasciclin (FAS1) repeats
MSNKTLFGGALALALMIGVGAPSAHAADVVDAAIGTPALSTLVELVVVADLVDTLKEAEGITVFAPTNDAFEKLPRAVSRAIEADPTILTKILTYHVAGEELSASEVVAMKSIETLQGKDIRVKVYGDRVYLNFSRVTATDIATDNATVHLIDRVLFYPGIIGDVVRALRMH